MSASNRLAAQIISIHALREESDSGYQNKQNPRGISIHALREESDAILSGIAPGRPCDFYPRSP